MSGRPHDAPPPDPASTRRDEDISIFEVGNVILENRWRVAAWMVVGGVLAVLPLLFSGRTYTSDATFVVESTADDRGGLSSLADQFGVALPGRAGDSHSPEFYADLLTSRVILGRILDHPVPPVEGMEEPRVIDLLDVEVGDSAVAREEAIRALRDVLGTSLNRTTGVLSLSVTTPWPRVSHAIAEQILRELNRFNLTSRQSQAGEERRFIEGRLEAARRALEAAESDLAEFLQANRQFSNSPELQFQHDRLQREVSLRQQVLVGLSQSYEDARIREVRDVPTVTVVQSPTVPARPDPRGRLRRLVFGAVVGGFLGILAAFARYTLDRHRAKGDADALRFAGVIRDMKREVLSLLPRRRRSSSPEDAGRPAEERRDPAAAVRR